jgi:hypothetical protein
VERWRERLEKLLQATSHAYDLRLSFGERDGLGESRVVIGVGEDAVLSAEYPALKGRSLHLLGHYLSRPQATEVRARASERAGRPSLVRLWHALEDARLENRMLERWPGMAKAFAARWPPHLGGSLLQRAPSLHQVEWGVYLSGRGIPGAQLSPSVWQALDDVSAEIRAGAGGAEPDNSFEAIERAYPRLAPLLSIASGRRGGREPEAMEPEFPAEKAAGTRNAKTTPEGPPEIEIDDGLFSVHPMGERRELPEWYRPGNAPWFEQGLGGKQVHPSAERTDRQTIVAPPRGDVGAYRELWLEVQHEAGFLFSRLLRLLQEEAYLRYAGRYRSGKLEMNRLWKQRRGDYRLFQRPEHGGRRQVAVCLLVDESASMQGQEKHRMAAKAAVLLGEALSRLQVPFEIIGFTTAEFEAREAMRLGLTPAHAYRTTRCSPLEHRIYKSFDEPYRSVRTRLSGIQPRHNNWDEEHLLFAHRRIRPRPEASHIMVVLSDGQPNGDADHLIRAVASIEKQGCRVFGVGIGADFVRRIYSNALVVKDFHAMAEELAWLLARELGKAGPSARQARLAGGTEAVRPW